MSEMEPGIAQSIEEISLKRGSRRGRDGSERIDGTKWGQPVKFPYEDEPDKKVRVHVRVPEKESPQRVERKIERNNN